MSIDLGREKATAAFSLGDGRSRRTGFRDNDEFVGAIGVYSTGPIIQVAGKRYCAREGDVWARFSGYAGRRSCGQQKHDLPAQPREHEGGWFVRAW